MHIAVGVIRHHTYHATMTYGSFSSIGIPTILVTLVTRQLHYKVQSFSSNTSITQGYIDVLDKKDCTLF